MRTFLQAARPLLLDLAAALLFAALVAATHSALVATAAATALGAGQVSLALARGRPVAALQWASLGLVLASGAASLATHDARFMMFKPSVVYAVVGAAMLQRGWLERYLPERARTYVPAAHVTAWGYAWAGLMLATAALNAAYAVRGDIGAWSRFVVVFPLGSKAALFAVQYPLMRRAGVRRWRAGQAIA